MRRLAGSIRLRMLLYAFLGTLFALAVSGAGLNALFSLYLDRRLGLEVDAHIAQLAGNLQIDGAGAPLRLAAEPADPRFRWLYSGLYWEVRDEKRGEALRSVSLWDSELPLPADALPPGATHVHQVAAPEGGMLMLHETRIILADGDGERTVRISVGVNRAEADILAEGFFFDMLPGLALLFAALVAGAWVQVGAGLRPVARVGKEVQAVREGRLHRLGATVPTEILPLVEETNSLLSEREEAVRRARDRAADLAHGLKTPLTALNTDIARLREKGETGLADSIEALALRMRRTVERELARARMRHHGGVGEGASPVEAADAIARILQRTPAADGKSVTVSGERDVRVAIDPDDLNEVLGNLIENAVRHAASRVAVAVNRVEGGVRVSIDDDGAGAGHETLERLTQRGVRDDERGGSAGLGLAIVSDILALYDRAPHFDASALGGLCVTLTLPVAGAATC